MVTQIPYCMSILIILKFLCLLHGIKLKIWKWTLAHEVQINCNRVAAFNNQTWTTTENFFTNFYALTRVLHSKLFNMLIDYISFSCHDQHIYFYSLSYTSRFWLITPTNRIKILVPTGFDLCELNIQLATTMIHFHMLLSMFHEYSMLKGPDNFLF